jgi:hypothetical protein
MNMCSVRAQADALGTQLAGLGRVLEVLRVGADAEARTASAH